MDDIKTTFSRRLRQARTMCGLSLRGLGEALKDAVSHNALAKYENGQMMPSSEILGQLADVLKQPLDFFFRPFTLRLEHIRFRKRVRLGIKQEESIRARALEFFERYHEVEQLIGEARKFAGKLPTKEIRNPEGAETAANMLREKWKLGCDPLGSLVELLESQGIKVFEVEDDTGAFDGFSADTEAGPVIVVSKNLNPLRKRMTIVHELAHVVLEVADSISGKEEELIAARFAGALLMPKEKFEADFGKIRRSISLAELIELKVNFGASIWAVMMRARQLELITEAVFVRFCQFAASWRSEKKEPGDERYQGNENHSRFRQLIHRAVAEGDMSLSKGAGMLNQSIGDLRGDLRDLFS